MLGKCCVSSQPLLPVCPSFIHLCLDGAVVSGTINSTQHAPCPVTPCAFPCFVLIVTPSVSCSLLQQQTSPPLQGGRGWQCKQDITDKQQSFTLPFKLRIGELSQDNPTAARCFSAHTLNIQGKKAFQFSIKSLYVGSLISLRTVSA